MNTRTPEDWLEMLILRLRQIADDHRHLREHCRRHPDAESVHRLRVATRGLLALMPLVARIAAVPEEKCHRQLKRILRATAKVRDLHVLRRGLLRTASDAGEAAQLAELWQHREQALARHLAHTLRSRKLDRRLERFVFDAGAARIEVGNWLLALQAIEDLGAATRRRSNQETAEELHRERLAVKKARYVFEALESWVGPDLAAWNDASRKRQRLLGEIHDLDVLGQRLFRFTRHHRKFLPVWLCAAPKIGRSRTLLLRRYRKAPCPSAPLGAFAPWREDNWQRVSAKEHTAVRKFARRLAA